MGRRKIKIQRIDEERLRQVRPHSFQHQFTVYKFIGYPHQEKERVDKEGDGAGSPDWCENNTNDI